MERSHALAALWFMRLVVRAAFGIKRFAFAVERDRDSLAQMSRFGQKIIEMPQSLFQQRRL
jgi:hypothetical protein